MKIEKVVTKGVFSLDGEDFDVEDNIWIVGDAKECIVIDAAHEADPIVEGVGRSARADDRVHARSQRSHQRDRRIAAAVGRAGALCILRTQELWEHVYPRQAVGRGPQGRRLITVGGARLQILHTPGHTPGGVSIYDGEGNVFVGDTLFQGGPGATGRSFSNFPTIIQSIRTRLLTLPSETVVYPGHGDTTTIGAEAPHLDEWIERGY